MTLRPVPQQARRKPPGHLSDAMKAWWQSTDATFMLDDHHRLILSKAAEAFDLSERARVQLEAEGLTFQDRWGQTKPHPAASIQQSASALFSRLVRELDLDENATPQIVTRRGARYK